MAQSRGDLRALYNRLEKVLGPDHAETLMTRLPPEPVPLASKTDVGLIRTDVSGLRSDVSGIRTPLAHPETRFGRMEDRSHDQAMTFMVTTVGAMSALTGIFGVIVSILR